MRRPPCVVLPGPSRPCARDAIVPMRSVPGLMRDARLPPCAAPEANCYPWRGAAARPVHHRWSRRLLAQNATLLLLSDGLDLDAGAGIAEEMARMHRSCRSLIWLNPLLRYRDFAAKAAGIRAMLPHVDRFLPAHNLVSLRDVAAALSARPDGGDRPWKCRAPGI